MKLPLYQLDAFTDRLFGGNPAAVVLLGTTRKKQLSAAGRTLPIAGVANQPS